MKIWRKDMWQNLDADYELAGTPAFQFGFGLFETILVQDRHPVDLSGHLGRLVKSMAHLDDGVCCGPDMQQLQEDIILASSQCKAEKEVLKILMYRTDRQWQPLLLMRPYPYSDRDYERGFALRQSAYLRNAKSLLVYHKTLNYLENYLERQQARRSGYDESFFLNAEGIVTECTAGNLFIIRQKELITSPVEAGLLPGITRMKLLAKAGIFGFTAREAPIDRAMLRDAEMVLLTNSLYGAMPVSQIDGQEYPFDQSVINRIHVALGRNL